MDHKSFKRETVSESYFEMIALISVGLWIMRIVKDQSHLSIHDLIPTFFAWIAICAFMSLVFSFILWIENNIDFGGYLNYERMLRE